MDKPWWQSKTKWAAMLTTAVAIYHQLPVLLALVGIHLVLPTIPQEVFGVLAALGVWGLRDAQGKTLDAIAVASGTTPPTP